MKNDYDYKDPQYWKWGIFYYNKNGARLFPPKRNPYMGWTINFSNPKSILVFVVLIVDIIWLTIRFK